MDGGESPVSQAAAPRRRRRRGQATGALSIIRMSFMWRNIFLFLDEVPDVHRVAPTCRMWADVVASDVFWCAWWAQHMAVWDVLRFIPSDETWLSFNQRTLAARAGKVQQLQRFLDRLEVESSLPLHYQAGNVLLINLRQFEASRRHFLDCLDLDERKAGAVNNLGVSYLYEGILRGCEARCYVQAIAYFEKAMTMSRCLPTPLSNAASAWNMLGRFDKALELLEQVDSMGLSDKTVRNAYHHKGYALYRLGHFEAAARVLNAAIAAVDDYCEAYFTRGLVKRAMGDHDGATADFATSLRQAQERGPWNCLHTYAYHRNSEDDVHDPTPFVSTHTEEAGVAPVPEEEDT